MGVVLSLTVIKIVEDHSTFGTRATVALERNLVK